MLTTDTKGCTYCQSTAHDLTRCTRAAEPTDRALDALDKWGRPIHMDREEYEATKQMATHFRSFDTAAADALAGDLEARCCDYEAKAGIVDTDEEKLCAELRAKGGN